MELHPDEADELFDSFCQATGPYFEIFDQAQLYHRHLFIRRRPPRGGAKDIRGRSYFILAIEAGSDPSNITTETNWRACILTAEYLREAKASIIDRLDKVEKAYFSKLRSWSHLPIVTYGSKTREHIKDVRLSLNSKFYPIDAFKENDEPLPSIERWRAETTAYIKSLDCLKALTHELSAGLVDWEKYVGDRQRLNVAVGSLILALVVGLGFKSFDEWREWRRDHKPPISVKLLARCALGDGRTKGQVCREMDIQAP